MAFTSVFRLPKTAQESPTFEHISFDLSKKTATFVVPEKVISIVVFFYKFLYRFSYACVTI